MVAARWDQVTPEALSMIRIIWAEALTDRVLAARYVENIIRPAINGLAPLLALIENEEASSAADRPLQQRMVVATFLGLTMMKLFNDPVLDTQMGDVPAALSKFILSGLSHHPKSDSE